MREGKFSGSNSENCASISDSVGSLCASGCVSSSSSSSVRFS